MSEANAAMFCKVSHSAAALLLYWTCRQAAIQIHCDQAQTCQCWACLSVRSYCQAKELCKGHWLMCVVLPAAKQKLQASE